MASRKAPTGPRELAKAWRAHVKRDPMHPDNGPGMKATIERRCVKWIGVRVKSGKVAVVKERQGSAPGLYKWAELGT